MSDQYTRDFITLKQDRPGYGNMGREPSGRCIIEKKGDSAKVTVVTMGLNPQHYYKIYLINATGQSSNAVCIGNLKLDAKGKAEQRIELDPYNIAGIPLSDFNVFAILVSGTSEPTSPLVGYKKEEILWRNNFRELDKNNKQEDRNATQEDFFQGILDSVENPDTVNAETSPNPIIVPGRVIPVPIVPQPFITPIPVVPITPVPVRPPFIETPTPFIETPITEPPLIETPIIETPFINQPGTVPIVTEPLIPGVYEQSSDLPENTLDSQQAKKPKDNCGCKPKENQPFNEEPDQEFSEKESQTEKFLDEELFDKPDDNKSSQPRIQSIGAVLEKEAEETDEEAEDSPQGSNLQSDNSGLVSPWQDNSRDADSLNPTVPQQTDEKNKPSGSDLHESFLNMANKLNLHLKELEEHTTAQPQTGETITDNDITGKNIEYIFLNNPVMKPFQKQRRPVNWVRITIKELALLNIDHWKLMNHPFVISAEKKYNHLILGMIEDKTEKDKYGYYLGVPDKYSSDLKQTAYRLGFIQFKSDDDKAPQDGDYGYWLMPV